MGRRSLRASTAARLYIPCVSRAPREVKGGLLTHSFSGRALAVKRVTEDKGKNTPGVDKVIWKTPGAKTNAIAS
ncbi:reverse transcriptase N-terminal domain-containing protein [Paraburkholderia sediminicola]|uniref:reverse transcriptase N-terminal domain-containing protein n=1 Tax=Paraburkholderia sediminicola TaxID=458836 RepID=UPI0038BD4684